MKTAPSEDSLLCKAHLVEVRRYHNKPDYIPKWSIRRESVATPTQRGVIPTCAEPLQQKLIRPAFAAVEEMKRVLGVSSSSVDNPIALCQHCYNVVCRQLNPSKSCASCGAIPKGSQKYCHHSPDPLAVTKHLEATVGISIQLRKDDYICINCYKMHCNVIESSKMGLVILCVSQLKYGGTQMKTPLI